jgi:hypothetical protein
LQYGAGVSTTASFADRILDDAAMFPPGNASAETAIREHLTHQDSWYARFVGPLLVPADRWPEFAAAHEANGSPELEVVLIGSSDRPTPVPPEVSVLGFEVVAPEGPDDLFDTSGAVALEVPSLDRLEATVEVVADLRARGVAALLKYRTGGLVADAFPSAADLATVVAAAVRRDVPVKFTAGLHHAVRYRDEETGFEHHGFLNVMWAVVMTQEGVPISRVVEILEERDPDLVRQVVASWSTSDLSAARATFASFGCCGVTDPVHDLVELGLLAGGDSPEGAA